MNYFITAISTDSGKSVVSALLTHALNYNYWKPVQAGEPADSDYIRGLVPKAHIHPETYKLNTPCSPHEAAVIDGVEIEINKFKIPQGENLIIEGAGGVFVPINNKGELIIDLIKELETECIIVSNHYLGSINHTLLTINALQNKGIKIKGIIFNGEENKATEEVILKNTGVPLLFRIGTEKQINNAFLQKYTPIVLEAFTHE
jgi:dethiobiotin synthetase